MTVIHIMFDGVIIYIIQPYIQQLLPLLQKILQAVKILQAYAPSNCFLHCRKYCRLFIKFDVTHFDIRQATACTCV